MPKFVVTIECDTVVQLRELSDALTRIEGLPWLRSIVPVQAPTNVVPTVHTPPPAGQCSGGHGDMRLIAGGTARSGPRMGQPYPAFWKCDTCGERQELRT